MKYLIISLFFLFSACTSTKGLNKENIPSYHQYVTTDIVKPIIETVRSFMKYNHFQDTWPSQEQLTLLEIKLDHIHLKKIEQQDEKLEVVYTFDKLHHHFNVQLSLDKDSEVRLFNVRIFSNDINLKASLDENTFNYPEFEELLLLTISHDPKIINYYKAYDKGYYNQDFIDISFKVLFCILLDKNPSSCK